MPILSPSSVGDHPPSAAGPSSKSPSPMSTSSTLSAHTTATRCSDIQPPLAESDSSIRLASTGRSREEERVWEAPDYTVSKVVEVEGNRHVDLPRYGATCTLHISSVSVISSTPTGLLDKEKLTTDFNYSKYFRNESGEVQIGNADSEIDRTLERAVQSMRPGETARVTMRSTLNMVKNGAVDAAAAADAQTQQQEEEWVTIEARLKLDALLNAQPIYKWYPETKLDKARETNASAVRLFKTQRFLDALHKFQTVLRLLAFVVDQGRPRAKPMSAIYEADNPLPPPSNPNMPDVTPETLAEAEDLAMTCRSNLAAVHFRWGNHGYVVDLATKVLDRQPENVKLLYRRGVSRLQLRDLDGAKADLAEAHRLDPANKAINEKLGQLRVAEKKQKDQMASGMKKMFG